MLLGELGEVADPLVLPAAPPVLLAPALPEVPPVVPVALPVELPLELCSFRHFSFSAPIRLSHLLLPALVDEAPVPAPMLVPLEVVPVPALGAALGLVLVLELADPLIPVPALPVVVLGVVVVALGVLVVALGSGALLGPVVVVADPLTPVLLEAPVPVVPVLPVPAEVPAAGAAAGVELLEVLVLDLLVAPVPLSEAQPAPKATSAAAVAAASSFSFIAFLLLDVRARCAPGLSKSRASASM